MTSPYLVAVVEDNPALLADLVEFLKLRGFAAYGFESAEAFFQAWPATRFDLLVLDVALPGASGFDIAQRVRAQDNVGVVMLTGLDTDENHVSGLDAGADMFLTKRSSLTVIEAACHSVLLRRTRLTAPATPAVGVDGVVGCPWRLRAQHWHLDAPNGISLELTQAEVTLLSVLFASPGQSIARDRLLAHLGKQETLSGLRNLDNTASRLRRKVQAACGVDLPLRPSYGKGYTFTGRCEVTA